MLSCLSDRLFVSLDQEVFCVGVHMHWLLNTRASSYSISSVIKIHGCAICSFLHRLLWSCAYVLKLCQNIPRKSQRKGNMEEMLLCVARLCYKCIIWIIWTLKPLL